MVKLLSLICLSKLLAADIHLKDAASFLILSSSHPEYGQLVQITPIDHHHLNLKSPQSCGKGEMTSMEEQKIECSMKTPGANELQIFVCDNANTFCRREILKVHVSYPNSLTGWWTYFRNLLSR